MKKIIFGSCIISLLAGCGNFKNKEVDGTKDIRIVCVSKPLTEMVFALGKGRDIVVKDHQYLS